MSGKLVAIGGTHDGERFTVLHGNMMRAPVRKPIPEYVAQGLCARTTNEVEYEDYRVEIIHFRDGAPVEFLVHSGIGAREALQRLLDAYDGAR